MATATVHVTYKMSRMMRLRVKATAVAVRCVPTRVALWLLDRMIDAAERDCARNVRARMD